MNKIYFENLDGLRFFCFLSVFLGHSFYTENTNLSNIYVYDFIRNFIFSNSNLGVNFFFSLSGFLITFLLLKEKQECGNINIRNFYLRRILRIWPLFYFCIFFGFVLFPLFKFYFGQTPNECASLLYYLLFVNNFDYIKCSPDSSVLSVLWSVAIEEQFYLIWPLILYFVNPIKVYVPLVILLVLSLLFRIINVENLLILQIHTISVISDMIVGGLFAYLSYFNPKFTEFIKNLSKTNTLLLYITVLITFLFRQYLFDYAIIKPFERIIIAILFSMIIVEQNLGSNSLFKMKNYKIISKLGTYTYGLYCTHFIALLAIHTLFNKFHMENSLFDLFVLEGIAAFILSVVLAYLSYNYFEIYFLNFKNKLK